MKFKPSAFLAAVAVALLAPTVAHASFAPRLSLRVDPATPRAVPAVEATLLESAGDTPPRRFTLSFPAGFGLKHPHGVQTCSARQKRARACRRASEIGSVELVTASGARLRGTLNLARQGSQRAIVALVRGGISFTGHARLGPDGGPQVTLDGLPNLALASLTVRFTGGGRGLVQAPGRCGAQTVAGLFTSQLGELAIGLGAVQIAGC
jgi:hypothetical protein